MKDRLWASFYGNDHAKATLALECKGGRLPHAILLEGETGCGKKMFARLLAQAAVCEGGQPPCGVCRHCIKARSGVHPDIILIDGRESAKNLNVDAVRAVRAQAGVKPNEAARKVFILADAQAMTPQAQNALLKVLEDPPGGVMFLLTCDNRSRLLETILSRVTLVRLEPPAAAECALALRELVPGRSETDYQTAAQAAGGNIGRAAANLEDERFAAELEAADQVARAMVRGTEYDLLCALAVYENDRDGLLRCLRRLHGIVAGLLKQKYCPGEAAAGGHGLTGRDVTAGQCRKLLETVEEGARMLEQNMGYPLASAWICARSRRAMAGE